MKKNNSICISKKSIGLILLGVIFILGIILFINSSESWGYRTKAAETKLGSSCTIKYENGKQVLSDLCCRNRPEISCMSGVVLTYSINCKSKTAKLCFLGCDQSSGLCKGEKNIPSPKTKYVSKSGGFIKTPTSTPIPTLTSAYVNRTITIDSNDNEVSGEFYTNLRSVFYIFHDNPPNYKVRITIYASGDYGVSNTCSSEFKSILTINEPIKVFDSVKITTERIFDGDRQFIEYYIIDGDKKYFINKTIGSIQNIYIELMEYDKNTNKTVKYLGEKKYCLRLSP